MNLSTRACDTHLYFRDAQFTQSFSHLLLRLLSFSSSWWPDLNSANTCYISTSPKPFVCKDVLTSDNISSYCNTAWPVRYLAFLKFSINISHTISLFQYRVGIFHNSLLLCITGFNAHTHKCFTRIMMNLFQNHTSICLDHISLSHISKLVILLDPTV